MIISHRVANAVRGIIAIKNLKEPAKVHDIHEMTGISISYLEQLFAHLRRAGIVGAVRGPGGGYTLIKSQITLFDIVKALETDEERVRYARIQDETFKELNERLAAHLKSLLVSEAA